MDTFHTKINQDKDVDSRTTLGLYLELQAHYIFYLIGNEHGKDGAHMGPTDDDSTGKLFEDIASGIMRSIRGLLPRLFLR